MRSKILSGDNDGQPRHTPTVHVLAMDAWAGKLTRIEAIKIIDDVTDKDDPYWTDLVEAHYDEKTDTAPSIFDVLAALGVTEAEYREASGADGQLSWPQG